jgi:hypothetical protein
MVRNKNKIRQKEGTGMVKRIGNRKKTKEQEQE